MVVVQPGDTLFTPWGSVPATFFGSFDEWLAEQMPGVTVHVVWELPVAIVYRPNGATADPA